MNTGMMVNLIGSLFQSFEIMMGLVKLAPRRPGKDRLQTADHGIAEYLPPGALRRIRLSDNVRSYQAVLRSEA